MLKERDQCLRRNPFCCIVQITTFVMASKQRNIQCFFLSSGGIRLLLTERVSWTKNFTRSMRTMKSSTSLLHRCSVKGVVYWSRWATASEKLPLSIRNASYRPSGRYKSLIKWVMPRHYWNTSSRAPRSLGIEPPPLLCWTLSLSHLERPFTIIMPYSTTAWYKRRQS